MAKALFSRIRDPVRGFWRSSSRSRPTASPVFRTFEEAALCCNGSVYGSGLIESVVLRKTEVRRRGLAQPGALTADEATCQSLLPVCLAINGGQRSLSVIDFGGACGAHYFVVRAVLDKSIALRWHVVENPAMAERAQELANDELRFGSSLSEAISSFDQVDLIYTSGALQYLPDPYACLKTLAGCRSEYLAIARVPVTNRQQEFITVDETRLSAHGPGAMPDGFADAVIRVPLTIPAEEKLRGVIVESHEVLVWLNDNSEVQSMNGVSVSRLMMLARLRR